jgi:hypothetical protein
LDPNTGSTITVVEEPMLFARVRGVTPALVHDFVRLVAAESYSAGKYSQFVLLYRWSLADNGGSLPAGHGGRLLITVDGQMIELLPLDQVPAEVSRHDGLFAPSSAPFSSWVYRVDVEQLRLIAMSQNLTVQLLQDTPDNAYTLWRDGRPALSQLIKQSIEH